MKKYVAFSIAVMVILSLLSGCAVDTKQASSATTSGTSANIPTPAVQALPAVYEETVADLITLIEWKLTDGFYEKWSDDLLVVPPLSYNLTEQLETIDGDYTLYDTVLEQVVGYDNPNATVSSFGYILRDINADNTPELFWVCEDRTLLAVFTVCDGRAKLLDYFMQRYSCVVTDDNRLVIHSSFGVGYLDCEILKLDANGCLVNELSFHADDPGDGNAKYWKQIGDDERVSISEGQFDDLAIQYSSEWGNSWQELPISFFEGTSGPKKTLNEKLTEKIDTNLEKLLGIAANGGIVNYNEAYGSAAREWQEIAEVYYNALVRYEGWLAEWEDVSGNDNIIKNFRDSLEEYKSLWKTYVESQEDAYATIVDTIYSGGSLGSLTISEHQYNLSKQWALQVVDIYELMLNIG